MSYQDSSYRGNLGNHSGSGGGSDKGKGRAGESASLPNPNVACRICDCFVYIYRCGMKAPATAFRWEFCENRTLEQMRDGEPCIHYVGDGKKLPRERKTASLRLLETCCCIDQLHHGRGEPGCSCEVQVQLATKAREMAEAGRTSDPRTIRRCRALADQASTAAEAARQSHGDCPLLTFGLGRFDTICRYVQGVKVEVEFRYWDSRRNGYAAATQASIPQQANPGPPNAAYVYR